MVSMQKDSISTGPLKLHFDLTKPERQNNVSHCVNVAPLDRQLKSVYSCCMYMYNSNIHAVMIISVLQDYMHVKLGIPQLSS